MRAHTQYLFFYFLFWLYILKCVRAYAHRKHAIEVFKNISKRNANVPNAYCRKNEKDNNFATRY